MSDFPKAPILKLRWVRGFRLNVLYARMANASTLYIGPINITWRMPWLPSAAYSEGWDACFRQMYGELASLKERLAKAEGRQS